MSEMSPRLSLNRIDHSTEAAAEDVKECLEVMGIVRLYTRDAYNSWSKVNPNLDIWAPSLAISLPTFGLVKVVVDSLSLVSSAVEAADFIF